MMDEKGRGDRNDELIAELVRLGGPSRDGADAGADELKARLRPLWREEVRRHRRTVWIRTGAIAGLAAAILFAIFSVFPRLQSPSDLPVAIELGEVASLVGDVRVERTGSIRRLFEGSALAAGASIETGESSLAAFSLVGGGSIRLGELTRIRFENRKLLLLDRGRIYIDSDEDQTPPIVVDAGIASVREIGTQFEVVAHEGEVVVRVRRGSVLVDGQLGADSVEAGEGVRVEADRLDRLPELPAWDPYWDWIGEAVLPIDVEGLTAASYLEWIERETGLTVRYADERTERLARDTTLHGVIRDIGPRESLEVVLPAVALRGEIDESSTLVVESIDPGR